MRIRTGGLLGLAMAVALAGCNQSDDIEYSGGRSELDITTGAQEAIKAKLRDPDSAKFSAVHVSSKSGMDIVCGKVNSRNGFGGMGGSQQFISNGVTLAFLEEDVEDGTWPQVWQKYC